MSLDIRLATKKHVSYDNLKTFEVEYDTVFDCNITHNLNKMADAAGIYEALWRPHRLKEGYDIPENDHKAEWEYEESNEVMAKDIIPIVEKGLIELKERPNFFKQFDSPNGWGLYVNFVPFVEKYLKALKDNPEAIVRCDR